MIKFLIKYKWFIIVGLAYMFLGTTIKFQLYKLTGYELFNKKWPLIG